MPTRRSAFAEATRTPPFSYVYWGATAVEVALAVWSWVWASPAQRSVAGWVILLAVLAQGVAAQVLAARVERRRAAEREGLRPADRE
jgi:low affinity Fe/Cu permease